MPGRFWLRRGRDGAAGKGSRVVGTRSTAGPHLRVRSERVCAAAGPPGLGRGIFNAALPATPACQAKGGLPEDMEAVYVGCLPVEIEGHEQEVRERAGSARVRHRPGRQRAGRTRCGLAAACGGGGGGWPAQGSPDPPACLAPRTRAAEQPRAAAAAAGRLGARPTRLRASPLAHAPTPALAGRSLYALLSAAFCRVRAGGDAAAGHRLQLPPRVPGGGAEDQLLQE